MHVSDIMRKILEEVRAQNRHASASAEAPHKNPPKRGETTMTEQILGLGLSLVIWVGSMVGMVIGFGLKPIKWIRKAV